jgi:DNA repair exonuclease SbcCD ATPase subunit
MITFTRLLIKDFMALGKVDYDFTPESVRLLLGQNNDSTAADDNGSGKSSFAEAFRWCLYGETVRQAFDKSLTVEHVIREGQKSTQVSVWFHNEVEAFVATRSRTKTSQKLVVKVVGGQTFMGKPAQEVIESVLGIDVTQFSNLVHLDGAYPKLFAPSTDRVRKDILADLVDIAITQQMRSMAITRLNPLEDEAENLERANANDKVRIHDSNIVQTQAQADGKEYARQRKAAEAQLLIATGHLQEAKEEKERCEFALAKEEDKYATARTEKAEELAALKAEQLDVVAQMTELNYPGEDENESSLRLNSLRVNLTQVDAKVEEIRDLQSQGVCPTCKQDTSELDDSGLSSLMEKAGELQDEISRESVVYQAVEANRKERAADCAAEYATLSGEVERHDEELAALLAGSDEVVQLRTDCEAAQAAVVSCRKERDVHRSSSRQATRLLKREKEAYMRADEQVTKLTEAVEERDARLEQLAEEISDLQFWKAGFGPKGVPSLFIETVLPRISERIQRFANILTGGDVTVSLRAYKETKSNTIQEAIQIHAVNSKGASVYGSNSTGERGRVNLAVTLGLLHYFRDMNVFHTNVLICDEVFDGLDSTGVEAALWALEEADLDHVIVISHHEHLKPLFPEAMYAVKKNGVTSVEVS